MIWYDLSNTWKTLRKHQLHTVKMACGLDSSQEQLTISTPEGWGATLQVLPLMRLLRHPQHQILPSLPLDKVHCSCCPRRGQASHPTWIARHRAARSHDHHTFSRSLPLHLWFSFRFHPSLAGRVLDPRSKWGGPDLVKATTGIRTKLGNAKHAVFLTESMKFLVYNHNGHHCKAQSPSKPSFWVQLLSPFR